MKIIHCADLHLDSQMTANLTKEQARERKREIIRTFTRMVEYAEKTGVRLIMISGDLFDTRNVSALARNTVRDMICTHPQIDFLYLRGNHDSDNFLSKLEEVPDNLLLFSDTWTAYRYGNIVISGIELSENNRATVYNSLVLGHEDFNIVMMHGQAGDYACRTQAENISLNQLKNKNIDYLALGHVHTFMQDKLDNRGTWCYCGCLEGRGFDECGPKGFVLLDVDEQTCRAQMQFVQMAARTLYTLEVDVSNVMTTREAAERMEEAVKQAQYPSGSRDIVQVIARHAAHSAFHLRKRGPPHLVLHRVSQHRSQMPQHLRLVSDTEHIQVEQAFAVIYRAVEIEHPHRVSFPLTLAPLPARQNCA